VEKQNATLKNELSQTLQRCKAEISESRNTVLALTKKLGQSKALSKALSKCQARARAVKENAVRKAREVALKEKSVHRLIRKGTYTEETRNLVRLLVQCGCSQDSVNKMIHAVLRVAGVSMIGKINRRSVSRFIREGFYAAQVQLGYEMDKAASMTFSADGTMHRSINYNARHAHLKVESYSTDQPERAVHVTRFLGIHFTIDGSSEHSVKSWNQLLDNMNEIYNASPLAKRTGDMEKIYLRICSWRLD
jgi:hypothetical protein